MKHIVYIELMFNIVYNKAARKKSKRRKTPTKNPLWVVKYIEISKFIFLAIVVARFLPCINDSIMGAKNTRLHMANSV